MSQEVLYRKWRPKRFADVAGQEPITTTLRHAVAGGTPAHAYLFTGPRGTGKTSTGRILAKAVNCTAAVDGEPCDACPSCEAFATGRTMDTIIELDAASNRGIDEVRAMREAAGIQPGGGRYKVYLIDEVHMLTDAAFNALLKTLEEPPPHIIFVLATTEAHRIPATIVSRCQRFDFRRINLQAVVDRLAVVAAGEGITVAPGGLEAVARQATGSLRDAVNLLDQLVAYDGVTLDMEAVQRGLGLVVDSRTTELARAMVTKDLGTGLTLLSAARDDGVEIRSFVREVVSTLRALLMLRAGAGDGLPLSEVQRTELGTLAKETQTGAIVGALRAFGSLDFAGDPYDSLPAEIAFASFAVGLGEESAAPVAMTPTPPPSGRPAAPATRGGAQRAPGNARPGQPQQSPQPPQARPSQAQGGEQQRAGAGEGARRQEAAAAGSGPPPRTLALPDEAQASPELVAARAQWATIRERARKRSIKAGSLLAQAQVKQFADDSIEVGFQFRSHLDKVQEDANVMLAIREAVAETMGRPIAVVPVLWEALHAAGAAAAASASPSPSAPRGAPEPSSAPSAPRAGASGGAGPGGSGTGGHLLEEALKYGAVPVEE